MFEELLELTRARARRLSSSGRNTDGDGSMFSGDGSARKVRVNRSLGVRCSGDVGGGYAVSSSYSGGGANGTGGSNGGGGDRDRGGGRGRGGRVLSLLRVLGLFLRVLLCLLLKELLGTSGSRLDLLCLLRLFISELLRLLLSLELSLSAGSGLGDKGRGLCDGLQCRGRGGSGSHTAAGDSTEVVVDLLIFAGVNFVVVAGIELRELLEQVAGLEFGLVVIPGAAVVRGSGGCSTLGGGGGGTLGVDGELPYRVYQSEISGW